MIRIRAVALLVSLLIHIVVLFGLRLPRPEEKISAQPVVIEMNLKRRPALESPPPASKPAPVAEAEEGLAKSENPSHSPTPTISPEPTNSATPSPAMPRTHTPAAQPTIIPTFTSPPETPMVPVKIKQTATPLEKVVAQPETARQQKQEVPNRERQDKESAHSLKTEQNSRNEERVRAYRRMILQKLNTAQRYPRRARRREYEGQVTVAFSVEQSGRLRRAWIEKSSGQDVLDDATLGFVQGIFPMPPPPDGVEEFRVTLDYTLK